MEQDRARVIPGWMVFLGMTLVASVPLFLLRLGLNARRRPSGRSTGRATGLPARSASAKQGAAMVPAIKIYYIVFAVLTVVGGFIGYVKAKSVVSLIAGLVSGALLVTASLLLPNRPEIAYTMAIIVSVLLAGKFVPDFIHKKAVVPGGLMALLSLVSIVLTLLAWHR